MKRGISIFLLSLVALAFVACEKTQTQESKGNHDVPATSNATEGLKVAYVQMDSLMINYQGYKDMAQELEQKAKANEANIRSREAAIQREMVAFNEKLQSRGFVNELAAQQEYERIQQRGARAQEEVAKMTEQFLQLQQQYNDSIGSFIHTEIARYNETKGYDFIFTNLAMSTLIYAGQEYDITQEVTEWLNSAYQKAQPKKD